MSEVRCDCGEMLTVRDGQSPYIVLQRHRKTQFHRALIAEKKGESARTPHDEKIEMAMRASYLAEIAASSLTFDTQITFPDGSEYSPRELLKFFGENT